MASQPYPSQSASLPPTPPARVDLTPLTGINGLACSEAVKQASGRHDIVTFQCQIRDKESGNTDRTL